MSASTAPAQKAVPAHVGFLAIYNPSLGTTDDTLDDQIVYYSSAEAGSRPRRRRRTSAVELTPSSQEERNDRLRKIGLAQGIVEFGRDFSQRRPVDTIETEQSRIILHELESGWWLIASIQLTRLPSRNKPGEEASVEYSSREVKPPTLLLEDLLRAHSTFLLHHASSMSALFVRIQRPKFCNLLGRYWDSFLSTWNVMLHGNPVANVYGGIKLAASGELGVGVGEEDRGSGERAVLEGFVGRIDGLVDLVVSKFGDGDPDPDEKRKNKKSKEGHSLAPKEPWLGTGKEPTPEDGAVFLGVGALSRKSLRDVTHWMEDVYSWGSRAYGVKDNPTSTRRGRRRVGKAKHAPEKASATSNATDGISTHPTGTLRPRVTYESAEEPLRSSVDTQPSTSLPQEIPDSITGKRSKEKRPSLRRGRSSQSTASSHSVTTTGEKFVNYLKLGYGTHWTLGASTKSVPDHADLSSKQNIEVVDQPTDVLVQDTEVVKTTPPAYDSDSGSSLTINDDSVGHYMIGLMGDIESNKGATKEQEDSAEEDEEKENNYRLLVRTVTVELEREGDARAEADISIDLGITDTERSRSVKQGGSERTATSHASFESQDRNKTKKLRIVVYVRNPFVFTFLFENRTDALALLGLYSSLHHQLAPLQRPLLTSTRCRPLKPETGVTAAKEAKAPIYDLVWDSKFLTISSTIPNIPEPMGSPISSSEFSPWSRIEALNTHMQLLNTFSTTRSTRPELEQTCKTSRGWWIVWNRILDPDNDFTSSGIPSPTPSSQATPLKPDDSVRGGRSIGTSMSTGNANQSLTSGPAHPFLDRELIPRKMNLPKYKEVFLLRRASDYVDSKSSGRFGVISSATGESGWGSGPAKLAQGIGVDTKRYIESLLSISR